MTPLFAAVAHFFFRTRLGQILGISLLATALLVGLRAKWRGDGAEDERVRIAKDEMEPLRKSMERERAVFAGRQKADEQEKAQNRSIIEKQAELIGRLDARIADIDRKRAVQAQAIAQMTDAEAFADLTRRLAVRAPNDSTPALYPGEIRKADALIADGELQGQKIADLTKKVDAQSSSIGKLQENQKISDRQLAAALDYIEKADARFKDAYNVFQRTHPRPRWQKLLSFGLLKDRKITELKPIAAPDKPEGLKAP